MSNKTENKHEKIELTELINTWQDYSKSMSKNLMEILEENQKEYEKLNENWTELSSKFGAQVSRSIEDGNKEINELYNVWRNYATKLSSRFTKVGGNGGVDYGAVLNSWEEYMKKMNHELFGNGSEGQVHNIFNLWDAFNTDMQKQMQGLMNDGNKINTEMTTIWNDFSSKMNEIMGHFEPATSEYRELTQNWQKVSQELNVSISEFLKSHEMDMVKLQEEWMKNTERMGETFSNTFEALTTTYGEIYNKYFERTTPFFTNLSAMSNSRVKTLEKEIETLKERIARLEARLK